MSGWDASVLIHRRSECINTIRPPMPVSIDNQPIKGGMSAPDTGDEAIGGQSKLPRQIAPPSADNLRISGRGFFPSFNCRVLVPLLGVGVPIEARHEHRHSGAG